VATGLAVRRGFSLGEDHNHTSAIGALALASSAGASVSAEDERRADESYPAYSDTIGRKERVADCAVLPGGSFEQHGDYLPLIIDAAIVSVIAENRERLSPPSASAGHHLMLPWEERRGGTLSISSSTFTP